MTHSVYLATLLVAIGCMALVDRRWHLVAWASPGRAAAVLAMGMGLFLGWDLAALHLGFYRRGESAVMTGVQVASGLPLEEVFFVFFLCYLSLVLHRLVARFVVRSGHDEEANA
ncbi:MAG: lycopene cyclase domain-containing protein [Nocardioidaceae bacterium]